MKRLFLPAAFLCCLIASLATRTFGLTLEAALQTTIEKNPEIQRAKCGLEQAVGQRLIFRAVGLPDAVIGIVAGVQGGHRAGEKSIQAFGFGYGNFLQPLFNAAVPASFRRGDVELLIAQQRLNVEVAQQLHAARIAFYSALYNRSLRSLREEQRSRLEENVVSQKARYEAGLVDRGAFTGVEVETRNQDPRVESAQRAYGDAILKLAEEMGSDLDAGATLPNPGGELVFAPIDVDLDAGTTAALERRADLKLARLVVRAANEDQRIIEAGYYPAINATISGELLPVSGTRRTTENSDRRTDDIASSEIRAGGAYTWHVIDNGKVYGAVMKQREAREINKVELRKLEADVPRELSRIQNNLKAIATKQSALKEATAAAEQNATIVQQNLASGVASQFEFRQVESTLLETKSALVTLAYQQKVALAEWDRALGRYFQFSDDSAQNVH
jgi:outer membrane protein TolC